MKKNAGMKGKPNRVIVGAKRVIAGFLTAAIIIPSCLIAFPEKASAVGRQKVLTLATCKTVAIANSEKIEAVEIQIEAKQAARESAIRSLQEKQRSMQTFRWSPLLNFKFPTTPNESEAFEFAYKPEQLKYDIETLKHKINDLKIQENEKVSGIYIDIITSQAEITFLKQRISNLETTLLKNKARLALGLATEAQIKQQEKRLEGYKKSLSSEQTKLQRSKTKLGKEVGFDITDNYVFEDAFIVTNIDRKTLESLQKHARDNDHTVFEARQEESLAKLALNTNYNLMKSQYGNNIGMISGYVQQALDGSSINKRAFKKDYDAFLKKIDEPWVGKKRILFFKFPKEWWKGDTDGIRYVEDDPYVLYTAALEYESALKEYNNTCTELDNAVADGYDNLMETRKAYITALNDLNTMKEQLIYDEALNALGQMSLEEYDTELGEYESARSALKDALSLYSKTLFEFDKTTCGAASQYFVAESLTTQVGHAGLGTPPEEGGDAVEDALAAMQSVIRKGATYSIRSIVDSEEFMLYIDIPEGFEYNITDFELWSDGRQIGERTPKGESIKHLTLTVQDVDSVSIALYNGDEFVDKCAIDPTVSYGPLNITVGYEKIDPDAEKYIGTYTLEEDENTGMIKLRFTFDKEQVARNFETDQEVAFYNISAQKNLYLFSNDLIKSDEPFAYMSFIKNDIGKLTVRMFAEDGSYIGGASINTGDKKLYADQEITLADVQEALARQIVVEKKSEDLLAEKERVESLLAAAESVDTGEAESPTVTHYKERLEEIEKKLAEINDSVTQEEIAQSLTDNADEIEKRIRESESASGLLGPEGTEEPEDEAEAKSAILKSAAEDFVKEQKLEALKAQIDQAILDKETRKLELLRQLGKAKDKSEKDKLSKELLVLTQELEAEKNKLTSLNKNSMTAGEDEILAALEQNGDDIYSKASDRLSMPTLYGSEIGQWAVAYLEQEGFEASEENVRAVVRMADSIDDYEKALVRMDTLVNGMEEAKRKAAELRKSNEVADISLADQLEKIADSYGKEILNMESVLRKTDPAKEVRIADLKKQRDEIRSRIEDIDKSTNGLLCVKYVQLSECLAELNGELNALKVTLNLYTAELGQTTADINTEIQTLQRNGDDITKYRDDCEAGYNEAVAGLEEAKKKFKDSGILYTLVCVPLEKEVEKLKKELEKAQDAYGKFFFEGSLPDGSESSRAKIARLRSELETFTGEMNTKISDVQTQIANKEAALEARKNEWYDSKTAKDRYKSDKKALSDRLDEVESVIASYY